MAYLTSGNQTVDSMGTVSVVGNVTPQIWYRTITRDNGKPYLLAIAILADICYWYRPTEMRDESSGQIIGWKKKFRGKCLQKSYQQYAELLGESKRTVKAAIDRLVELGIVKRHFDDVTVAMGGTLRNVMFLDLNIETLKACTYPDNISGKNNADERKAENISQEVLQNFVPRHTEESNTSCFRMQDDQPNNAIHGTESSGTNTEITTETINKDYQHPINPENMMDETDEYIALIKNHIDYNRHKEQDEASEWERFEEIYGIICDVVCVPRKTIRIEGEDYPYAMVRSRFLKLDDSHVEYVIDRIKNTSTKISNIRAYIITALYHAPTTKQLYIDQEVQHDMYGGGWSEKGIK